MAFVFQLHLWLTTLLFFVHLAHWICAVPVHPSRRSGGVKYVVQADEVTLQPAYENSINPFLSHIEQGWKLRPVKHRYLKKKLPKSEASALLPLEVDPSRPHFMDSNEAADAIAEENKAFGDEEKDLRELFQVLFSSDY